MQMYGAKILEHLKPLIFHLGQMEKLMVLGVPILKHFRVVSQCLMYHEYGTNPHT